MGREPAVEHHPGGDLLMRVKHPAFDTVEHLFRVLPEDGWFSPAITPRNPVKFELGSFHVPQSQMFLICDYEFVPLIQSGVDSFDFRQAASYRFSGFMGFDLTVSGRRASDLFFQLDPAPTTGIRTAFIPPVIGMPPQAVFNQAAANSFGSVAGAGNSLLPARPNVQGARGMPFTLIAMPGDAVALSVVIFRRVTAPLAAIQGSVSGYMINSTTMSALLERMRPR